MSRRVGKNLTNTSRNQDKKQCENIDLTRFRAKPCILEQQQIVLLFRRERLQNTEKIAELSDFRKDLREEQYHCCRINMFNMFVHGLLQNQQGRVYRRETKV